MVQAVVLLNVYPGKEFHVKQEITKLKEVKTCRITYGEYDIVIEVNTDKVSSLGSLITKKIRSVEGVSKSITLIDTESVDNNTNSFSTASASASPVGVSFISLVCSSSGSLGIILSASPPF